MQTGSRIWFSSLVNINSIGKTRARQDQVVVLEHCRQRGVQ